MVQRNRTMAGGAAGRCACRNHSRSERGIQQSYGERAKGCPNEDSATRPLDTQDLGPLPQHDTTRMGGRMRKLSAAYIAHSA